MATPNQSWDLSAQSSNPPGPPSYNYTKYRELLASKQILKRDIKDLPLLGL